MSSGSSDSQEVTTTIAVSYVIDGNKAAQVYQQYGDNIQTTTIEPAIQESVKSVTGQFAAAEVITKRVEISDRISERIKEKVQPDGVIIKDVNITDVNFSPEFNTAIEKKAASDQERQTALIQLETTKIEAQQKAAAAQGDADAIQITAQSLAQNGGIQSKHICLTRNILNI